MKKITLMLACMIASCDMPTQEETCPAEVEPRGGTPTGSECGPGCGLCQSGTPVHATWQALEAYDCELLPLPSSCQRLFGRLFGATILQASVAGQLVSNNCSDYVCDGCIVPPPCDALIEFANQETGLGPIDCAFDEGDFDGCSAYGDDLDQITVAAVCGELVL